MNTDKTNANNMQNSPTELDLSRSVYELVNQHPDIAQTLARIGFKDITNRALLITAGRVMTLKDGAAAKGIAMSDIIKALEEDGYTIAGRNNSPEHQARIDRLKGYLRRLNKQEDLDAVRRDFVKDFEHVDASEIMEAEQTMISEGTPVSEIQNLCDLHSALFHGRTKEERIAKAEEAVEASLARKQQKQAMDARIARYHELSAVTGHPLATMYRENQALAALFETWDMAPYDVLLDKIAQLSIHYAKKGDLFYPLLKTKYGVTGPADVMWSVDDEIRDALRKLTSSDVHDETWREEANKTIERAREMLFKEENILFPISASKISNEDWKQMYFDMKDYDTRFDVIGDPWRQAEEEKENAIAQKSRSETDDQAISALENGLIKMPTGSMHLNELTALLNLIPMEITFVDADNINRYFNAGHKEFKRPLAALGREVFSCHPAKVEPIVRHIINEFRKGNRDDVSIWMKKKGEPVLVQYLALRDENGSYLGTVELCQNMQAAKEHFEQEARKNA